MNKIKWYFTKLFYQNNDKKYIKNQYEYLTGAKLDLDNPQTFNEKIQWFKLYVNNDLVSICADKYLVRNYVMEKGLSSILPKLYCVYDNVNSINYDELPNKFVMKANNGSGGVIVCADKTKFNINKAKKYFSKVLKNNYYKYMKEWQYSNIQPKIIIEELIETDSKYGILDYKFFCFNGKVKCIYVSTSKANFNDGKECIDYYDSSWNYLNITRIGHPNLGMIEKPKKLDEMIEIAQKLSKDFPHVRVDLYCENEKIYFGELTFTTGSGYNLYSDQRFDLFLGENYDVREWIKK